MGNVIECLRLLEEKVEEQSEKSWKFNWRWKLPDQVGCQINILVITRHVFINLIGNRSFQRKSSHGNFTKLFYELTHSALFVTKPRNPLPHYMYKRGQKLPPLQLLTYFSFGNFVRHFSNMDRIMLPTASSKKFPFTIPDEQVASGSTKVLRYYTIYVAASASSVKIICFL